MDIHSYTEITTRGADPTQLETWECSDCNGVPFTVTQFFGDYLIEYQDGKKETAPREVVLECQAHADLFASKS